MKTQATEDLLEVRRYVPFGHQWIWGLVVYYLQPASVCKRQIQVDFPVTIRKRPREPKPA